MRKSYTTQLDLIGSELSAHRRINGGSANKAPYNKNLVKLHSSHSGDPLGHRHHKTSSVLWIYLCKQIKSFQRTFHQSTAHINITCG